MRSAREGHKAPRRLARAFPEIRFAASGASYVPDVGVYRWERIPRDATGRVANDFRALPDIAVEVVSPGQSATSLVRKCLWYVDHGAAMALVLDPDDESALLVRPDHTVAALRGVDPIRLDGVLPGFTLSPAELFQALRLD